MPHTVSPFPLPQHLESNLSNVLAYWRGLRRAGNAMPFWDDLRLSMLSSHAVTLFLLNVFDKPERFRFDQSTSELLEGTGDSLSGKFIDEADLPDNFSYLRAQCSATVEARAPTYYRHESDRSESARQTFPAYARLLLPLWGDGRIGMLLGAIDRR